MAGTSEIVPTVGTGERNDIPTGEQVVQKYCDATIGTSTVITGTSEGSIGAETAKALAAKGKPAKIFLLARTEAKVRPVLQTIAKTGPSVEATFVQVDLLDFDSVRKAGAHVLAQTNKIHYLFNYAGVHLPATYGESTYGVEQTLATNHVGHFLLTKLLLPALISAGPRARVVQLSSSAHVICPLRLDNLNFNNGKSYNRWEAYGHADVACILFARELARRLRAKGHELGAFAADPGFVPDTHLNDHLEEGYFAEGFAIYQKFHNGRALKIDSGVLTLAQGSTTPLVAALDPSLEGKGGSYICDAVVVPDDKMESWAVDDDVARKLWEWDESIIGDKFL